MHTIVLASQKGGSGKTTLAGHLAVEASRKGPVVLVDTDPQGSLSDWWNARPKDNLHFANVKPSQLGRLIEQWRLAGVRTVLIDTPPALTETIRAVVAMADLVVIPTKPSPHDFRAMLPTVQLVQKAGKPFALVINAAVPRARLTAQAAHFIKKIGPAAPVIVHHRVDFAASMIDGRVARELNRISRSSSEIKALWKWVITYLRKHVDKREGTDGNESRIA